MATIGTVNPSALQGRNLNSPGRQPLVGIPSLPRSPEGLTLLSRKRDAGPWGLSIFDRTATWGLHPRLFNVRPFRALRAGRRFDSNPRLEVLRDHCEQPTLDEWLDGLNGLTPVALPTQLAAEAVREAREAEDDALVHALGRP